MSRSRKHSPCTNVVIYRSNKKDKVNAHRAFRAKERHRMIHGGLLPMRLREVSDTWDFASDGLAWWHTDIDEKEMRK